MMPPPNKMRCHQAEKSFLGCSIERRGGLVEQPDRSRHGEDSGKRQPPPLSRREIAGGQVGEIAEADLGERLCGLCRSSGRGAAIEETGPKTEVLGDRQGGLEGIEMPYIMGLLADTQLWVAPVQGKVALGRPD